MSRVGSRLFALTVRWLKFVLLHYCLKGMYLKLFSEIISRVVWGGGFLGIFVWRKKVNIVFIFDVQLTKRDGPVIRMIYDYITYMYLHDMEYS